MKNLKTSLHLGLVSSLLLSTLLCPITSQTVEAKTTSFLDQDEIKNTQAVTIVNAVGLMLGDEEGNFNPSAPVSRVEMAVICTTMLYGSNFQASMFAGESLFSDTPDWAVGYVNAAASQGIIAGYGDGTFAPDSPVMPTEAMLMLLKTLGYFQKSDELAPDWSSASFYKSQQVGLYVPEEDGRLDIDTALSRENVATLVFRAITAVTPVAYNPIFDAYYPNGGSMIDSISYS